jgi:hypothetical protein
VLIYETFADGQQTVGRPSRPDFLLQPGELLPPVRVCTWWPTKTVSSSDRSRAFVQRIVAVAEPGCRRRGPRATGGGAGS